jgi:hypothetical protein
MRNGKAKPDTKRKSNKVGSSQNKEVRRAAKKALPKARGVEVEKEAAGWKWIRQGKTSKQVHPNKLQEYLDAGWVLTKI